MFLERLSNSGAMESTEREGPHKRDWKDRGRIAHLCHYIPDSFHCVTDYLQFVKSLLVVGTGGARWIKNSEPGVQSTIMGAGVHLGHKHGNSK